MTGQECARYTCFYNKLFSLERNMCFFNSAEYACLEQRETFSTEIYDMQEALLSKINSIHRETMF
jgi:hypothetical protein